MGIENVKRDFLVELARHHTSSLKLSKLFLFSRLKFHEILNMKKLEYIDEILNEQVPNFWRQSSKKLRQNFMYIGFKI